jgi:hypothetical protein
VKDEPKVDLGKQVSYIEDIVNPVVDATTNIVKKTVDTTVGPLVAPVVNTIIDKTSSTFRLTKLPQHDRDFATDWFYATQQETVAEDIVNEYNAYLQAFEELEQGKIKLPEGYDGAVIASDIRAYVLHDFRSYKVKQDTDNNLVHRAYYCHCVKRALDSLRQGEYTGPDGYTRKRPEIADMLENRINQILFDKMMGD